MRKTPTRQQRAGGTSARHRKSAAHRSASPVQSHAIARISVRVARNRVESVSQRVCKTRVYARIGVFALQMPGIVSKNKGFIYRNPLYGGCGYRLDAISDQLGRMPRRQLGNRGVMSRIMCRTVAGICILTSGAGSCAVDGHRARRVLRSGRLLRWGRPSSRVSVCNETDSLARSLRFCPLHGRTEM